MSASELIYNTCNYEQQYIICRLTNPHCINPKPEITEQFSWVLFPGWPQQQ